MRIYNSLSKKIENVEPATKGKVVMYVCGLTPYDKIHIGHARAFIAFDVVKRWMIKAGHKVLHVQNITDVDDKIIKRCKETGADPKRLTTENHDEALELLDRLNVIRADVYPKVTEHIPEIIEIIKKIMKNRCAYETKTGVYFDVSEFKGYGRLSGQKLDEIRAGSRKEVDETKDDPADFALWKKTKGEIIEFDSPWGKGRPGWHIECSAMSRKYAKGMLDIHGGARDLIFPHHENEIAQSEAASGGKEKFVKYWMHTGFLTVNGEKMSKSLGNFVTLDEALLKFEPNAIRMFFALTHYRSPLDYNEEQIEAAGEGVERIFNSIGLVAEKLNERTNKNPKAKDAKFGTETDKLMKKIDEAMDNDFDTPNAIAALFNLIRVANTHLNGKKLDYGQLEKIKKKMEEFVWILGLKEREAGLDAKKEQITLIMKILGLETKNKNANEMLDELVNLRDEFRRKRDFAKSDKIRNELNAIGIILEDDKGKTKWKVK